MISYEVQGFGEPLQRAQRSLPRPSGREVLLKVTAAGVCHTDIHTWHGWYDMGGGNRLTMGDRGVGLPLTLGHEIAGEVLAQGPEAEGVRLGQSVLVYPWIGCGNCKVCRRGKEQLCSSPRFLGIFQPGGYSDHVLVPDARYLIDLGNMPPHQAAPYACSGLTTYSAIRKLDPQVLAEERVVVMGAGGLGLMCVSLLQALGCPGVVVVETDESRRQTSLDMGAVAVLDPAEPDTITRLREAAGGDVWAIIDCVGSDKTVQLSLDALVKGGELVQVGLFGGQINLPTPTLPIRSLKMTGSYIGTMAELRELMQLVRDKLLQPVPTQCRHLCEAQAALNELEAGKVVGRLILQP